MIAGTARIDITPTGPVWMDGMIRDGLSTGVHDRIYARALYLSSGGQQAAIVSLDVCAISEAEADAIRRLAEARVGLPAENIIVAATHTHSGPAMIGFFNQNEPEYIENTVQCAADAITKAVVSAEPVALGYQTGKEETISHYRRFRSKEGDVVMMWEDNPRHGHLSVLGERDPDLGVMKIVSKDNPEKVIAVLFGHAGHPNVMSGENTLISGDYAGEAERRIEDDFGCTALFVNGAQGTVDIDNWKYRDWDGVECLGAKLAKGAVEIASGTRTSPSAQIRVASTHYTIPRRRISGEQLDWAEDVLRHSGGKLEAKPDGVGDDYKALLYRELYSLAGQDIEVEQTCIAIGDTAFVSFPGELFTEIGMDIKAKSPFRHTCIIGLANGYIGYAPTREAISDGGYEVDTRHTDDSAADLITQHTLELLNKV